jgi:4-hydroxy-tetrahydrodipicolinate reductase
MSREIGSYQMKKARLVISGIAGRMGQEVALAAEDAGFNIAFGVDRKKVEGYKVQPKLSGKDFDVIIDFSSPELFAGLLDECVSLKKPLVSGTTGITPAHLKQLKLAAKSIPVLWAPNMSPGIAMFCELIEKVARLEDFDFQIEEFHHRYKKDRPSGTALLLQNVLKKNAKTEPPEPVAIRGGGIFGIHRLYGMSPDETLTIEHTALNRTVFAKGALAAARWLLQKPAGLYELKDTLTHRKPPLKP